MKVIFFGSSKFVIPILEILRKNYEVALVITTETQPTNLALQGDTLQGYAVIGYCIQYKIPYQSVKSFDENLKSLILNLQSPLGVLAYFGLILPKEILNLFPKGILNIHPSLLPKYRGPTPGQSAILNGEEKTGVTLIKLDEEVDHGPILGQMEEPILQTDTADSLYERLFAKGAGLLEKIIKRYLNNKVVLKEQDHSLATFTHHLTRQSGFIDLNTPLPTGRQVPPPQNLDRMIRAYHPWPGVWTSIEIRDKQKVTSRRIKLLPEKKVQVEGGKPMGYKDFLNGYPKEAEEILQKLNLLKI